MNEKQKPNFDEEDEEKGTKEEGIKKQTNMNIHFYFIFLFLLKNSIKRQKKYNKHFNKFERKRK